MKTTFLSRLTLFASLLAALAQNGLADKVRLEDTPALVQSAIKSHAGAASIEDIDRTTSNGQVVYEAAFKRNGQHVELQIAEDGTLLNPQVLGDAAPAAASVARKELVPLSQGVKVNFTQLPPAVQNALRAQAGTAPIEDIDKGMWNGKTVYQAAFKKNGLHQEVQFTEDGQLVNAPAATAAVSTQGLTITALPAAVQNVVRAQAGTAPIEQINQRRQATSLFRRNATVYEVVFKQNGQPVRLDIVEDGTILTDSRKQTGTGRPAASQSGAASSGSLSGAQKVHLRQLPVPARNTIQAQAGGAMIEDLERGSLNGQTVYEAGFKRNGQHVEVRVAEDGSVLSETAVGSAPGGTQGAGQQPRP